MRHGVLDTPIGPVTLVVDDDGALTGCYLDAQRHLPASDGFGPRDDTAVAGAARQLTEYFAGERRTFDLPLALATGTPFQQRVWQALGEIPYGETISYGELAARIGQPTASRAVGLANGRNPISIVVPCHRVVGANGTLTGYGGGLTRKQALLDLERGHAQLSLV
ncbi:methylated-DNA--[protein]-cysteine S-methyltransferase [Egicoccus halophilus]|uniref:Methylated-DNA--protein-cysteine methyltransferase n=1 Tax=Egicoccus halophilus TaxID=1670830 RepID=A0A8J3EST3_9ACTN|nr:methylated-DNA--[protein]-cysteine S-methyltransferase [Egicoccus halophilus]GGI04161.1 methylated-DNA--protein-cysteine methyltransferase [Egicoccus halophilus]